MKLQNKFLSTFRRTPLFANFVAEVYLPWARANKKSWQHDEYRVKAILSAFGSIRLSAITPAQIEAFKQERMSAPAKVGGSKTATRPRSGGTVNHELLTISRIFSLAIEQGIVEMNPARKVRKLKINPPRDRVCSVEEEAILLAHLPPTVNRIFRLAILTGMRNGEITALNWGDVDLVRQEIRVRTSKNGKPRTVPMSATVRGIFAEAAAEKADNSAVFLNQYGNRYKTPNWTFAEHCKRLGILGLRFHDLRHTAATRLAESGIDLFVMADILGHSDINMTRRYVTTTDARRRAAVEALARYGQSPPVPIETRDLAGE